MIPMMTVIDDSAIKRHKNDQNEQKLFPHFLQKFRSIIFSDNYHDNLFSSIKMCLAKVYLILNF